MKRKVVLIELPVEMVTEIQNKADQSGILLNFFYEKIISFGLRSFRKQIKNVAFKQQSVPPTPPESRTKSQPPYPLP